MKSIFLIIIDDVHFVFKDKNFRNVDGQVASLKILLETCDEQFKALNKSIEIYVDNFNNHKITESAGKSSSHIDRTSHSGVNLWNKWSYLSN